MPTTDQDGDRSVLYFDDLHVGQRFVTGIYRIDESEIVDFASRFDPQPFHTDPEAAKHTFFQGLVASGWHTAGISMRLLIEGGAPIAGGHIGAGAEISWPKPTRPGSELHVESEVMELKPSKSRPEIGIATVRNETRDQFGETVQVMTAKMIVPRRIGDASA